MPGALAHSPADIIRRLLIRDGIGVDPTGAAANAWPVFASGEPAVPITTSITVYDTQGFTGARDAPTGERAEFHGIQVKVRAGGHTTGYAKARAICEWMDKQVYGEVFSFGSPAATYHVHSIRRVSDVLSLGKDPTTSQTRLFTINALVMVRQRA